jgi:hypothetical protein
MAGISEVLAGRMARVVISYAVMPGFMPGIHVFLTPY